MIELKDGEYVWARCRHADISSHLYRRSPNDALDAQVADHHPEYAQWDAPQDWLVPDTGRHCKVCERWLAKHPEAVVRGAAAPPAQQPTTCRACGTVYDLGLAHCPTCSTPIPVELPEEGGAERVVRLEHGDGG